MTMVKLKGSRTVHISDTSISRDTHGGTLCGQSGNLMLFADDAKTKVCRACTDAERAQLQRVAPPK